MLKIITFLTVILFSNFSYAGEIFLSTDKTSYGCEDKSGNKYDYNTLIYLYQDNYHLTVQCTSRSSYYGWSTISMQKSIYNDNVYDDGMGCRDSLKRIYQKDSKIKESFIFNNKLMNFTYVCKEKNNHYYLEVLL